MSAAGGRFLVYASLEEDAAGEGKDGRRHWGEGEYPPHGRSHWYEMQVVHPASYGVYMSTRRRPAGGATETLPPIGLSFGRDRTIVAEDLDHPAADDVTDQAESDKHLDAGR